MPRAYWKGHLRLLLLTCPIELFPSSLFCLPCGQGGAGAL